MDKIKKAKVKIDEIGILKDQLARVLADYDNLRKRIEREKETIVSLASVRLVARLLPVLDNLERSLNHLKDSGLAIAIGELKKVINDEGFEEIRVKAGDLFSSVNMEAVEVVKSNKEEDNGKVAKVMLSGWRAKGIEPEYVVRPVKVKVFNLKIEN